APGQHVFIGLVIDRGDVVPESDEANNSNRGLGIDVAPLNIRTPLPDLVGASFHVGQPTALWCGRVKVDYRITNRGEGAAGPFRVEPRLSADQTIDSADDLLAGSAFTAPALAPGDSVSGTLVVTLPGSPTAAPAA